MLFCVGSKESQIKKAIASSADVVIIDLEDAVAEDSKGMARSIVSELLTDYAHPDREILVRINGLRTPYAFEDIAACVQAGLTGIMLPKVESPADIQVSDWIVGEFERQRRLPAGRIKLVPIIETAAGVAHVRDIAVASRRIPYLTFGAGDFSLDTKSYRETDSSLLVWARSQIVIASRLADLQMPVDTVYPRLDDEGGLRAESLLARDMGFQGKACIHPAQLEVVQSIFGPDPEVLRDAAETVRVFEEATAKGEASILLNGRLVDYAIAESARQLLRRRGL